MGLVKGSDGRNLSRTSTLPSSSTAMSDNLMVAGQASALSLAKNT
jgi:hypothetical protein